MHRQVNNQLMEHQVNCMKLLHKCSAAKRGCPGQGLSGSRSLWVKVSPGQGLSGSRSLRAITPSGLDEILRALTILCLSMLYSQVYTSMCTTARCSRVKYTNTIHISQTTLQPHPPSRHPPTPLSTTNGVFK